MEDFPRSKIEEVVREMVRTGRKPWAAVWNPKTLPFHRYMEGCEIAVACDKDVVVVTTMLNENAPEGSIFIVPDLFSGQAMVNFDWSESGEN